MGLDLAGELGLELPFLERARDLLDVLVERGDGDLDCSAIYLLRAP
jgi:hypothetical protein